MYLMYYLNDKGERIYTLKVYNIYKEQQIWDTNNFNRKWIPPACPPNLLTLLDSPLTTSTLVTVLLSRRDTTFCLLNFLLVLINLCTYLFTIKSVICMSFSF